MKIGLVAWHLNEVSGTATVIRELLNYLSTSKYDYRVVLKETSSEFNTQVNWEEQLRELGFKTKLISDNGLSREDWLIKAEAYLMSENVEVGLYFDINVPCAVRVKKKDAITTNKKIKTVCIIHDVLPLILPEYYLNPFKYWSEKKKYLRALQSDSIISVSGFSRDEIIRKFKLNKKTAEKIVMIYNGVGKDRNSKDVFSDSLANQSARLGVLYLGDFRNRKNVFKLAQAYLKLPLKMRQTHPLLLIGQGRLKFAIEKLYEKSDASNQVNFLGKLSDEEINHHFRSAYLFVFPSVAEGFGLPVIEAQRQGLPVVCGNHTSLSEVAGDSVCFAEVRSVDDLAEKMFRVMSDSVYHGQLAKRGYENSWRFNGPTMSEKYEEVFEKLVN